MHICLCERMCLHADVCMYVAMYLVRTYVGTHVYVCFFVRMYVCLCLCVCGNTYIHMIHDLVHADINTATRHVDIDISDWNARCDSHQRLVFCRWIVIYSWLPCASV